MSEHTPTPWLPIETARKDGSFIIVRGFKSDSFALEDLETVNCHWGEVCITHGPRKYGWVTGWIQDECNTRKELKNPTHWMPFEKESEDHAAYIVTAVSCHDELVEALKMVTFPPLHSNSEDEDLCVVSMSVKNFRYIKAALAKVGAA